MNMHGFGMRLFSAFSSQSFSRTKNPAWWNQGYLKNPWAEQVQSCHGRAQAVPSPELGILNGLV
jgi:hypothetical protein